jgi:hypothetical protein
MWIPFSESGLHAEFLPRRVIQTILYRHVEIEIGLMVPEVRLTRAQCDEFP